MVSRSLELTAEISSALLYSDTVHDLLDNLLSAYNFLTHAEIYRKGEYGWARVASSKNYNFKANKPEQFEEFLNSQSLHRADLSQGSTMVFDKAETLSFFIANIIPTFNDSEVAVVIAGETLESQNDLKAFVQQLLPILSNLHRVHNTTNQLEAMTQKFQEQKEALERSLSLLDSAGDAIFVHDPKGKFVDFNQQAIISLGYDKTELLAKRVKDIDLRVNDGIPLSKILKEDVKPGQPVTLQSTHVRKDGTQFPVEVTVSLHASGNYLAVARDISKRMGIRKELEDAQAFLKNIIELSDNILYVQDLEKDRIISGADKINHYFGYPEDTIKRVSDFFLRFRPEEKEHIIENYSRALVAKPGEVITYENQCQRADGKWIWVKSSITVGERNHKGEATKLYISSTDVTHYKKLEQSLLNSQQKYISLVENAFDAIVVIDKNKAISFASAPVYKMFNFKPGDSKGFSIKSFVHEDDHDKLTVAWDFIIKNPAAPHVIDTIRINEKDSGYKWTKVTLNNLLTDPHVEGIVVNISDISAEIAAKSEVNKKELYYQSLVESSFDGIALFDESSTLMFVSDATKKLLGYKVTDVLSNSVLDYVHHDDLDEVYNLVTHLMHRPSATLDLPEYRLLRKDGSAIWVQNTLTNLLEDPNVGGIISNFRDISSRKRTEQSLYKLSNFDTITGLPNRKYLIEQLKQQILKTTDSKSQFGLVIFDINSLNAINTAHGHEVGDKIIKNVAEAIKRVVSPTDFVSKIGADEFAILYENQSTYAISRSAQAIIEQFEPLLNINDSTVKVSLSAGISIYPKDANNDKDLISFAEIALKSAKQSLEAFAFYQNYDSEYTKYRLGLEKDLIEALSNDELRMVYQPVVESKTGKIKSFEALIRWQHPEKGNIEPSLFVKISEKSNLVAQLSQWVISTVIKQVALWNQEGFQPLVAINLSPLDIRRKNLNSYISQSLTDNNVSATSIIFEITESEELLDLQFAISQMQDLQQTGIEFVLDDFGTGFSSISHLVDLPISGAKIDRSFIERSTNEHNADGKDFLLGLINLIQGSGCRAVVEGVESFDQYQIVSEIEGLDLQGFLISKPLEAEQVAEWLTAGSIDLKKLSLKS